MSEPKLTITTLNDRHKELWKKYRKLERENTELKQLMQGLTPEIIQRIKNTVMPKEKIKRSCFVCKHYETVICMSCYIDSDKFEFFNDVAQQ